MTDVIDLRFRGLPRVIAAAVLEGADGLTLVDPGPTSCLAVLEAGLAARGRALADVRRLLLTHIHLDHAGASGTIVSRVPRVEVFVHERGAPHMLDPAKLIASATRLYGHQMDKLWGAFLPLPAANLRVLAGGERLDIGGRAVEVAYTPGHAVHHVSYFDRREGVAYVGDTGGIRIHDALVIAPTLPPDVDVELWQASLDAIAAWQPMSLLLTHFGEVTPAMPHVTRFRHVLSAIAERVGASLAAEGTDDDRVRRFVDGMRRDARAVLSEADAQSTETAAPFDQLWAGLARYWRKRM
jgi:glyoxylase-like metal-dependent hydrolase (beta-lactamase superfamily II)